MLWIKELLGNDELKNKETWAAKMVGAIPVEEILKAGSEKVDFKKVGTYGAAMELSRQEAPAQQRR